jgi:hypothetical protein
VFEVNGQISRPQIMFAQLVDSNGARSGVYRAGSPADPVTLPATVYIEANDKGAPLGVVVWLNDSAGSIIAYVSTEHCVPTTPHKQTQADLVLGRPPNGWTPAHIPNCRCWPDPATPMCPPLGVPTIPPPPDAAPPADLAPQEADRPRTDASDGGVPDGARLRGP